MSGETVVAALLGTLIGAVVGLVVAALTLWGVYVRVRTDFKLKELDRENQLAIERAKLEAEYDKDLRKSRIEVYKELFGILQTLTTWELTDDMKFTVELLNRVLNGMDDWYYQKGGLFLSERTHKEFLSVLDKILGYLLSITVRSGPDNKKTVADIEAEQEILRTLTGASDDLRHKLVEDINTRKAILFPDKLQPLTQIQLTNKPVK